MRADLGSRGAAGRYGVCTVIRFGGIMRTRATITVAAVIAAAAIGVSSYTAFGASGHDTQRPISTGCPTTNPPAGHDVVTYNDGWIDGCADAIGDDNRDGRLSPGEAGWTCRHTQLAELQACLTRAYR